VSSAAVLSPKIRRALAPGSLGDWPTPLESAPGLAAACGATALWLKREDRSSPCYGGNKVRGLEFLLGPAPADVVFLTAGGTGSSHCLATAVHAGALGARTVLAQFPQPDTDASRAVATACAARAALVVRAGSPAGLPLALLQAWRAARRMGPVRWIPLGGAHPRAVVGHLLAGLELETQLPDLPDAIVTPLGTGGTAAGLGLAVAALAWPTTVVGVRVAPRLVANRWRTTRLARRAALLLAAHGIRLPLPASRFPVAVVDGLGVGYGHPTPAGEAARRLAAPHRLVLDPTYGAKAFATVPELARRGFRRIVFWHTFALPGGA